MNADGCAGFYTGAAAWSSRASPMTATGLPSRTLAEVTAAAVTVTHLEA